MREHAKRLRKKNTARVSHGDSEPCASSGVPLPVRGNSSHRRLARHVAVRIGCVLRGRRSVRVRWRRIRRSRLLGISRLRLLTIGSRAVRRLLRLRKAGCRRSVRRRRLRRSSRIRSVRIGRCGGRRAGRHRSVSRRSTVARRRGGVGRRSRPGGGEGRLGMRRVRITRTRVNRVAHRRSGRGLRYGCRRARRRIERRSRRSIR